MKYRPLGKSGLNISAVSLGGGAFIRDQVTSSGIERVVSYAVARGVNLLDTAEDYGLQKLAPALKIDRRHLILSMKSTASHRKAMEESLRNALQALGTDHIEIFQLQTIQSTDDLAFRIEHGALEVLQEAKDKGVIDLIGLSSHRIPVILEAVRKGYVDVVTLPYSVGQFASEPAIHLAAERGVGVLAMMTLGGGLLVGREKDSTAAQEMTAALALRFVLGNRGVSSALVGMSSVEHAWENLNPAIYSSTASPQERKRIQDSVYRRLGVNFCRSCKACMPCDVFGWRFEIDNFFRFRHYYTTYGYKQFRDEYEKLALKADECTDCGHCEQRCPYDVPIIKRLKRVHQTLGSRRERRREYAPEVKEHISGFIRKESDAFKKSGDSRGHERFLAEYGKRFPQLELPKQLLADHYFGKERYNEALPLYLDLVAEHRASESSEEYRWKIAFCHAAEGEHSRALAYLDKNLKEPGSDEFGFHILLLRARSLHALKKIPERDRVLMSLRQRAGSVMEWALPHEREFISQMQQPTAAEQLCREQCNEIARCIGLGRLEEALKVGKKIQPHPKVLQVCFDWEVQAAKGFLMENGLLEETGDSLAARESYWSYWVNAERNRGIPHGKIKDGLLSFLLKFPDNPVLLHHLGESHLELGDYRSATRVLERTIRLRPRMVWPRFSLAKCHYLLGQYADALQWLEKEKRLSKDCLNLFNVHYFEALACLKLNKRERAYRSAENVLASPFWKKTKMPAEKEFRTAFSDLIRENGGGGDSPGRWRCKELFEGACILGTGDVVCSCRDNSGKTVFGNVYENGIYDILDGEKAVTLRERMLSGDGGFYCEAIGEECMLKTERVTGEEEARGNKIRRLVLEPTTLCNMLCPGCPAGEFNSNKAAWSGRIGTLSLDIVKKAVREAAPHLEEIVFFNFGEPFLHKDAIEMLKCIKKEAGHARITTSTNGVPLSRRTITEIVENELLDTIVFAIDGCDQDSYHRFRRGGDFKTALGNLKRMVETKRRLGKDKPFICWQYILFQWNDSDKQVARAQEMARQLGVEIHFLHTHTEGASARRIGGTESSVVRMTDQLRMGRLRPPEPGSGPPSRKEPRERSEEGQTCR